MHLVSCCHCCLPTLTEAIEFLVPFIAHSVSIREDNSNVCNIILSFITGLWCDLQQIHVSSCLLFTDLAAFPGPYQNIMAFLMIRTQVSLGSLLFDPSYQCDSQCVQNYHMLPSSHHCMPVVQCNHVCNPSF